MRFEVACYICMSIFINRIITRECAIFMCFIFRRFCCSCSCRYSRCCCKHLQLLTVALACVNLIIIIVVVSLGSPFSHMSNEAHGFDLYTQSHTFTYAHTHILRFKRTHINTGCVYNEMNSVRRTVFACIGAHQQGDCKRLAYTSCPFSSDGLWSRSCVIQLFCFCSRQ